MKQYSEFNQELPYHISGLCNLGWSQTQIHQNCLNIELITGYSLLWKLYLPGNYLLSHFVLEFARFKTLCKRGKYMSPNKLQQYLHDHIPLSKAMQVSVVAVEDEKVVLSAPLAPNINHRDTIFGGSASAIAILAAWSLLHTRLQHAGISSRLVIQRNTMDYQHPILGEFTARAFIEQADAWPRFVSTLMRKGRARISVTSVLEHAGQVVGSLNGEFVALGSLVS